MIRVGWAKEDPLFRRVFTTQLHPRCHRGADALVRRPPADVDLARERRREPDRAPGGRHRRRAPADHRADARAPGDRRPVDDVRQRRPGRRAGSRAPGSSRSRAATTSSSPTSRHGRVHRRGPRRSSSPSAGPTDGRAGERRRARCRRASSTSCGSRADGRTNEEIAAALALSAADRRAPPLERLREARASPARPRARRPSRGTCAGSLELTSRRLRVGRHRRRRRRAAIGCRRGSVGARRRHTVARCPIGGTTRGGATDDDTDASTRPRPASAPTRRRRARTPTVTATLAERPRPAVRRPVQLGRRPAARHRRREPRPEPDRLPARRAGRLRRRVPARHARAAVRRPRSTTSRPSPGARPTCAGCSGSTASRPTWPTSARHHVASARRRRSVDADARRLAGALPDLPRAAQSEPDRADDSRQLRAS